MKIQTTAKMKSTYMFRDQVNAVSNWFKVWNECEQTVALYSFLKKITPTQAKFLLQVLQQSVASCTQIQLMETDANSPAFINSLCSESKENAVHSLLSHLPLLRPGNAEAKAEYLRIIPKVLEHSIENGCDIEESRQLLSYSLIHPAINSDERNQLTLWLGQLEDRVTTSSYYNQQQGRTNNQTDLSDLSQVMAYADHNNQTPSSQNGVNNALYTVSGSTNGWQQQQQQQQHPQAPTSQESELTPHSTATTTTTTTGVGRPIKAAANNSGSSLSLNTNLTNSCSTGSLTLIPHHTPLHATTSGPPAFNSSQGSQAPNPHRKLTRSSSVTPPSSMPALNVSEWLNSQDSLLRDSRAVQGQFQGQNVNTGGSNEAHAPLSPQSSVTSSGSGSDSQQHPDEPPHSRNSFLEEASGMKDVPIWLKSLRLHKYAYIFQMMTYDEMMNVNESWLETQNVTKGARHKIVLSINKLRERQNVLRSLEKEILETGNLKQALSEIKAVLNTPLKPSSLSPPAPNAGGEGETVSEGDLPGQLTRVLGKVCTQLLVSWGPDDECFSMYVQLLDKCMAHEAFNSKSKKLLSSWRQQIYKIWHPAPQKYNVDKQRRFGSTYPIAGNMVRQRPLQARALVTPGAAPQWAFNKQPPVGPPMSAANLPLYRNNSINNTYNARPQIYDVNVLKQQVHRTHSAPIKSSQFGVNMASRPVSDLTVTEPEINARLDSLCLRMTEAALGNFDVQMTLHLVKCHTTPMASDGTLLRASLSNR